MFQSRGHKPFSPQLNSCTLQHQLINTLLYLIAVLSPALVLSCTRELPIPDRHCTVVEIDCGAQIGDAGMAEREAGPERSGTKAESWWLIRRLDAFVFDCGSGLLTDSYQQSFLHRDQGVTIWSGSGRRRVVVIANMDIPEDATTGIYNYDDLERLYTYLYNENPEYPIMYGETEYEAGKDPKCHVILTPVLCELDISLSCVFGSMSDRSVLESVQVYLTGISGMVPVGGGASERAPVEILCSPDQREEDLQKFVYPRMVFQYLGTVRDGTTKYTSLYCYPNPTTSQTSSMGAPVTTLVIEGRSGGETFRHTLPLESLTRNTRYQINIKIFKP